MNIEEPDVEEEGGDDATLANEGAPPMTKVTGFPPGNPQHISPTEAATRKHEEATLGREVACTRAWARATEVRAKKGGNPKHQAASGGKAPPRQATDFKPMSDAIKSAATGTKKQQINTWAPKVQFGSMLLAMKLKRGDFAFSDQEAALLTEATIDLLDFYKIDMKKAGPWPAFMYAVAVVGGPRIAALVIERAQAANTSPSQVQV